MSAAPSESGDSAEVIPFPSGWNGLPLTPEHAAYLADYAIEPDVARGCVRSITSPADLPEDLAHRAEHVPGILFTWTTPEGRQVHQYKPDVPPVDENGRANKYLFASGKGSGLLGVVRQVRNAKRALVVEGTKQSLAAASYAPADMAVYFIPGCWGLSTGEKIATPELAALEGLDVVVCFDADLTTNPDVQAAALWTDKSLRRYGAKPVRWMVDGDAEAKHGLDDVLRTVPAQRRGTYLENMIGDASGKPPALTSAAKKAAKRPTSGGPGGGSGGGRFTGTYFSETGGLLVQSLAEDIRAIYPAALTSEQVVAVYQNGVFDVNGLALTSAVTEALENAYRPAHEGAVQKFIVGRLAAEGAWLPDHTTRPLVNMRNGMLDLVTGELHAHHPSFFSSQQLPIAWDPDAQCPTYEQWVQDIGIDGQLDDLEEIVSTMLDPSMTPQKAVFLFGPSRSGKSTYLRLLQDIAGVGNFSAVTLHQLTEDRFAAANLYGMTLNVAADLSAKHVQDLSVFKMMTGEDPIQANRKFGRQFAFVNRALFAFSANELPTVGESSSAYMERVKPFEFSQSFAGREDPSLENRMRGEELPGILRRWVAAYQRRSRRGVWLPTNPTIRDRFEAGSDRVRQWVQECCTVTTEVDGRPVTPGSTLPDRLTMTHTEIVKAFNRWAEDEHGHSMSGKQIKAKLLSITGVVEVRRARGGTRAINVSVRPEGERGRMLPAVPAENLPESAGTGRSSATFQSESAGPAGGTGQGVRPPGGDVQAVPADFHTFSMHAGFSEEGEDEVPLGESVEKSAEPARHDPPPLWEGLPVPPCSPADSLQKSAGDLPGSYSTVLPAGSTLPEGVVAIDIETHSAELLWDMGPDFVRLVGYQTGDQITVTTDAAELVEVMRTARLVVGHNVMAFDLVAFAKGYGVDLVAMAAEGRVFDTMLASVLNDPPKAEGLDDTIAISKIMRERSLDNLGEAVLGQAKTGDLKALAREFGGFGAIPVEDPRFVEYLRGDVDLTARLAPTMGTDDYVKREHRVAAVAATMRMSGFRVDVDLLHERYEAGQARKAELIAKLTGRYGLPTVKADGKPVKNPHATKEGRGALVRAFEDLGVELPTTVKGSPALGKEALAQVAAEHGSDPEVAELVETVQALNGVRTVYGTVLEHLHGDRVHPDIVMFQASGRWSTTKPGLTVFGKRDGKYVEREVFLPEPGQVIIAADLAQVDARALAALSQDEAYLAMFAPGLDLHSEVAKRAFGEPPDDLDEHGIRAWLKARRTEAKIIGHGWNYGRGTKALGLQLAPSLGHEKAFETAEEFDRRMTEEFPRLVEWRGDVRRQGERGELLDNGFGRLMAVKPDRSWTQAPALMGQGCARDLMMEGLLRMPAHLLPCLRAVIHDEVVLSVPEARVEEYSADVVAALSFSWAPSWGEHTIEIMSDCSKPGTNWGGVYAE